jgi:hypothetical protein
MLMPGAHSSGPPEDGEHLPVWVEIFRKYFELKKSNQSKSVQQEQFRNALRTMQNTLVTPAEALGNSNEMVEMRPEMITAVATATTATDAPVVRHPRANTIVAPGGTVTVVPAATATGSNVVRNVRPRLTTPSNGSNGNARGVMGTGLGDLPALLDMMNKNTRAMMRRSFIEVNNDYKLSKAELATARAENDEGSISFYEIACRNLEEELKSYA